MNACVSILNSSGDGRVNEQPQLAVIHTMWVREHNRIGIHILTAAASTLKDNIIKYFNVVF